MKERLTPSDRITDDELARGLVAVLRDGLCSQAMGTLTTGVFLVGFGLTLGASNAMIGVLAALPFLANLMQVPAVLLVERLRRRKQVAVVAALVSRSFLLLIALAPLLPGTDVRLAALGAGMALHLAAGSVAGSAWNSWMRDLVPDERRGTFFGNRHFGNSVVAALLSLSAGIGVDRFATVWPGHAEWGYALLFGVAALAGLGGVYFLADTPEPRMPEVEETLSLTALLSRPFRDENFRRLIVFLGSWSFAVNLAAPFFTVYMLTRLGYGMTLVALAVVVSQVANLLVVRSLGRLTDQFSNRAVLGVCGPLFLFGMLAWPFTTMPEAHGLTLPLVLLIHLLLGFATAGLNLATSNIALKLAPRDAATSYLAAAALITSLCAAIAPILGGLAADFLASYELSVLLRWAGVAGERTVETLSLRHWDFFFVLAAVLGLYPLHRLGMVVEQGEGAERDVLVALTDEASRAVRNLSSVAGLRAVASYPVALLRDREGASRSPPAAQSPRGSSVSGGD